MNAMFSKAISNPKFCLQVPVYFSKNDLWKGHVVQHPEQELWSFNLSDALFHSLLYIFLHHSVFSLFSPLFPFVLVSSSNVVHDEWMVMEKI